MYLTRINKESLLRQIHTFLINQNIININQNIIDLGAWIGDNVLPWSKMIKGKIFAIDPSPENCELIKLLCDINDVKNVNILKTAISEDDKVLFTNDDLNHCTFVNNLNDLNTVNHKIISTSLDSLLDKNIINDIGFLHLDVEGMEFNVIKGSINLIKKYRPIITYEVHLITDRYVKDLKIWFNDNNYKQFIINETLYDCYRDCRNILCIPYEKLPNDFIDIYNNAIFFFD